MSQLRDQVNSAMQFYREFLKPDNQGWDVLEVGIDGDERPGGNYKVFGVGNTYKTLDFLARLNPDFVADVCNTKMPSEQWDLIIFSQTIEHVLQPIEAVKECYRMLKPGGFLIVDSPFQYPYHGLPEYDDYWRFSHKGLDVLLKCSGFKILFSSIYGEVAASALAKKC